MMAFDAAASSTSVSVMAPTLECRMRTFTLSVLSLFSISRQRFLRSLHVALQNDRHFLDLAFGQLLVQLIERQARGLGHCDIAQLVLAILRHLASLVVVGDGLEGISGQRQALQSENFDGRGRAGFFHQLAVLVEHGANFAVDGACDEVVADLAAFRSGRGRSRRCRGPCRSWLPARLPWPAGSGSALRFCRSATSRIISSSRSRFLPVFAETSTSDGVAAPVFRQQVPARRVRVSRARDSRRACRSC